MMFRSVTETLADAAHEVILDEERKKRSVEVDVTSVLESTVLFISIQDMHDKMSEKEEKKKSVEKSSSDKAPSDKTIFEKDKSTTKETETTADTLESASKPDDTPLEKNKEIVSDKILTGSDPTADQTLTDILNNIQTTTGPPEIVSSNDSTKLPKKVSQRAKVAKDTAAIMREYEKCGKECDEIVDKILADITVTPKAIDTDFKSSGNNDTGATPSKKNVKTSSKSTIEPRVIGPQKKKTIRLDDEQVRKNVSKGSTRNSN